MKLRLLVLAVALAIHTFLSPLCAQNATNDSAVPRFTSRSELVVVPVIVTRSGKHLSALTKEDFTILEDGKRQTVAHFEEIRTERSSTGLMTGPRSGAEEFSNIATKAPARFTIIVLDAASMRFENLVYAKRAVLGYLKNNLDGREPVALAVVTATEVKIVHDFTDDPAILVAALERLIGKVGNSTESALPQQLAAPVLQQTGAAAIDQEMTQIQATMKEFEAEFEAARREYVTVETDKWLRNLARSYAGIPGRKSIVWLGTCLDVTPDYDVLAEMANANISIYPVDTRGLVAPSLDQPMVLQGRRAGYKIAATSPGLGIDPLIDHMRWLAEATGGRAFVRTNDLAGSVARAIDDSASYYQLSYYLKPGTKPGWHRISVKVSQPHVEVRTRSWFVTGTAGALRTADDEVARILRSPLTLTSVPLTVRWLGQSEQQGEDGKMKRVDFKVSIPAQGLMMDDRDGNHLNFTLIVSVRNGEGTELQQMKREIDGRVKAVELEPFMKKGLHFNSALMIAPGEYTAKILVRDNLSGQIGTVSGSLIVGP